MWKPKTAELTAPERLRRYWKRVLIAATLASLSGNVVHALPDTARSIAVQIVLAAIAPVALLTLVHGLGLMTLAGMRGKVHTAVTVAVAVMVATAFVVSLDALRDLARTAGWSESMSWLLPVMLDLTVVVATGVMVVLDKPAAPATVVTDQDHTDADTAVDRGADQLDYPLLDPNRWSAGPLSDLRSTIELDLDMDQNAEDREVHSPAESLVRTDQDQLAEQVHDAMDQDVQPSLDQQAQTVADQSEDQDREPAVQPAEDQADQDVPPAAEVQRTTSAVVRSVPKRVDREPVQTTDADLDRARVILAESSMSYSDEQVAAVLTLLDAGTASRAVAEQTGISKSGVLRIKSAARELVIAA
ncbi:hypothetical protein TSOC111612_23935 [Tsukamurella ocularis]|uniref:DUF2637 domain-containing protein n=1 Tax=Tsukamurella ocularis TaxID=1970234 RepID=UPI0039F005BA